MIVILWGIGACFKVLRSELFFPSLMGSPLSSPLLRYCFGRRSWCPQLRKQIVPRFQRLDERSNNPSKRCHELQASTAFYWFAFAAFLGSAILGFMSGGSSFSRPRGGIRKGGLGV